MDVMDAMGVMSVMGGMDVIGGNAGMGVMGGMVVIVRMDAGQVNIYTVNWRHFLDGI